MSVEVAYARLDQQVIVAVSVPAETSAEQAILASGILERFPEIDLSQQKVGIFSQICTLQKILNNGDRIEIYRPLLQDPMTARRNRLQK
ncbi:MAG: RnfH family protein [Methylomonas lenta]|nr:RnfH family protein [Methylomonas lenta]